MHMLTPKTFATLYNSKKQRKPENICEYLNYESVMSKYRRWSSSKTNLSSKEYLTVALMPTLK